MSCWQVDALDRVLARLRAGGGLDEIRCLERMSDEELVLLAEREASGEADRAR